MVSVLGAPDTAQPGRTGIRPASPRHRTDRGRLRRRASDNLQGYAFLAAGLVCFGLFSWYPLVKGIVLSFQQDNFVTAPVWVGLDNYRAVFNDPLFATAWLNTAEFTGLALLFGFAVPFVVALVINEFRHAKGFFRIAVYLPVMLPPIVSVLLWKYFYDPGSGLFNSILSGLHLPTSGWTQSPRMAMVSLVLVSTWSNMGGATIMYLAGLASIPGELYEAAELDGAGLLRRLWHVTVPQTRLILSLMFLLQVVATMQVFIEPLILAGGAGVEDSATSVVYLMYQHAFKQNDLNGAAALGVMLMVVLAGFSVAYARLSPKQD
jgi:multiple sugar transport system permease protein